MPKNIAKTVPGMPPRLAELMASAEGNPDLELAAQRMVQLETLLEGIAELKGAQDATQRLVAEAKVAAARNELRGKMS